MSKMNTTPKRSLNAKDITDASNEFLWQAANELCQSAPTISQHLAASLVARVPDDGMSAFAKRMHCDKCGGLMTMSKVRIRKTGKRTRIGGTACRNAVLRTCSYCGKVNTEAGTERGVRPRLEENSLVIELRKKMERKRRKAAKGRKDKEPGKQASKQDQGVASRITKLRKADKKSKRKGKKSAHKEIEKKAQSKQPSSGLAASFLFEPL